MSEFYVAVIERPDSSTYEQPYYDFYDLVRLIGFLGDGYKVIAIY